MLVVSCHADTGFPAHSLAKLPGGVVRGQLDNFVGVYAVMRAYFSGRLTQDFVRIELTHGEEKDFAGAFEVLATLKPTDTVIVVDVTGTPTEKDLVIEKCRSRTLAAFLRRALDGVSFDLYPDCPDPIADADESDLYRQKCRYVFFLGVPCFGGDYNEEPVKCRERSIEAVAEAICRVAERYSEFCKERGIPVR